MGEGTRGKAHSEIQGGERETPGDPNKGKGWNQRIPWRAQTEGRGKKETEWRRRGHFQGEHEEDRGGRKPVGPVRKDRRLPEDSGHKGFFPYAPGPCLKEALKNKLKKLKKSAIITIIIIIIKIK